MSSEQEQQQEAQQTNAQGQAEQQDNLISRLPESSQRLHPDSIKVSRITVAFVSLIIMLVPTVVALLSESYLIIAIGVAAGLIVFTIGFIWAKKSYDYTWYWLAEEGLYIQSGVWWRKKTLIPFNRVQHTDVAQGPLERKYKLGKLVTHTAGTRDASVSLDGILLETAHELRSVLQEEGESDAV